MFKPNPRLVAALESWADAVAGGDARAAARIREQLRTDTAGRRPDLTGVLLQAARLAPRAGVALPGPVQAAAVRAGCAQLGSRFPGATVELRIPPWAAVQLGFGTGPRHTRGTPPNVVEMSPEVFLGLATGELAFDDARERVQASGAHASDVARAFPLLAL